jgi:hypothetical protein
LSSDNNSLIIIILSGIAAGGSVIAAITGFMKYRKEAKKGKTDIQSNYVCRICSADRQEDQKIQLLHPSENLKRCQILFNHNALTLDGQ